MDAHGAVKYSDERKDLQRVVWRLSLLDGPPVWCRDGLFLLSDGALRMPDAVIDDVRSHGSLSSACLRAAFTFSHVPLEVTPSLLATAQRDVRRLLAARDVLIKNRPLDPAWLARRQQRIDELTSALHGSATGGLLQLIAARHGAASAAAVGRLLDGLARLPERRQEAAAARLEALVRGPGNDVVERARRELADAARRSRRSRGRRTYEALRRMVFWPEGPPATGPVPPEAGELPVPVERLRRGLLQELWRATRRVDTGAAAEALLWLALAFRCGSGDIPPNWLLSSLEQHADIERHLFGLPLVIQDVVRLLALPASGFVRHKLGKWIAHGLEWDLLEQAAGEKLLDRLGGVEGGVEAARTWLQWSLALSVVARRYSLDLSLPPQHVVDASQDAQPDLAFLARVLTDVITRSVADDAMLALVDTCLGLLRRAPEALRSLSARLSAVEAGIGRRLFPAFSEWLGDDTLLDRVLSLQALCGRSPQISGRLLRLSGESERRRRELEHLRSGSSSEALRRRMEVLAAWNDAPAIASARNRLREQAVGEQRRALRHLLDEALQSVARTVWKFPLPPLDRLWQDALRLYLGTGVNRKVLATLLHLRSQGTADVKRALEPNRRWMSDAASRLDVARWCGRWRESVRVVEFVGTLELEEDVLEVLRMGIPFDTCLSIGDFNQASTVVNAADANKRVLYLKDARGQVVARKLLAVSKDWKLIGYRLYVSLDRSVWPAVRDAVRDFCRRLGEACGLERAASGEPARLNGEFWYDDGTVSFEEEPVGQARPPSGAVEAYCAFLGRSAPAAVPDSLAEEATLWRALQGTDVGAMVDALGPSSASTLTVRAADRVVELVGEREARRLSASRSELCIPLLQRAAMRCGVECLDGIARRRLLTGELAYNVGRLLLLERLPSTVEGVRAVLLAARAARRQAERGDWCSLACETRHLAVPHLSELPCKESFRLADEAADVWSRYGHGFDETERGALDRGLVERLRRSWRRGPDPDVVLGRLSSRRGTPQTLRAALVIAGRWPLDIANPPRLLDEHEQAPRLCRAGLRALDRALARHPELAVDPDFVQAHLRQSGRCVPDEALAQALRQLHGSDVSVAVKTALSSAGLEWDDWLELGEMLAARDDLSDSAVDYLEEIVGHTSLPPLTWLEWWRRPRIRPLVSRMAAHRMLGHDALYARLRLAGVSLEERQAFLRACLPELTSLQAEVVTEAWEEPLLLELVPILAAELDPPLLVDLYQNFVHNSAEWYAAALLLREVERLPADRRSALRAAWKETGTDEEDVLRSTWFGEATATSSAD